MHVSPISGSESSQIKNAPIDAAEVLIELDKLQHRIGRNADLLRDLISLFLSSQPKDIKALRQAIEAGDASRSKRIAHRIAGAFASLAMDIMAQSALEIEQQAAAGHLDACKACMTNLEARFEIVKKQLASELGRLTGR
ncbi:MAG: Hpt domain-containing protein [Burkholderiales bacterium]